MDRLTHLAAGGRFADDRAGSWHFYGSCTSRRGSRRLSERADLTDREIAAARRAALDVRSAIEVIAAPDVTRMDLKGESTVGDRLRACCGARGHGLVSAATDIAPPPAGMAHHVWLLTGSRIVHAGVLPHSGLRVAFVSTSNDIAPPFGAAVTIDPAGAPPTGPCKPPIPTGKREPPGGSR